MKKIITIGTRESKLAMWQTDTIAALLHKAGMETVINSMKTKGDKILDKSIAKIGSKGVFTVELEDQLASGVTDIAVHSAKDMQSQLPEGFELIAFSEREEVYDVLVSDDKSIDLNDSTRKICIGTSSVRRRAMLRHFHPHVDVVEMRGNLQTRIEKMRRGDCDALLLAYAGVKRMEYEEMVVYKFDPQEFTPPVGQGCIAIESSINLDADKREAIRTTLNNRESEIRLLAERAFLQRLEGGCSIPVFGLAHLEGDDVVLRAGLVSLDGTTFLIKEDRAPHAEAAALGTQLGDDILNNGGRELLDEIKRKQAE